MWGWFEILLFGTEVGVPGRAPGPGVGPRCEAPGEQPIPNSKKSSRRRVWGLVRCLRDQRPSKPYECRGFGAMDVTNPFKFIGLVDIHGPKPFEFIHLGFYYMIFGPAGNRRCSGSGRPRGPQEPFKNMGGKVPHPLEWLPGPTRPP